MPEPSPAPPSPAKRRPQSAAALAARRANLRKARAADRDLIYRPTPRRRAASRRNIQRAIAWRRSPRGNARARLNALQHGLAAKHLPGLLRRLGEGPEDFARHHERVRRVFRPREQAERRLVERLARATWRHIRLFKAQARHERWLWQRWAAKAQQLPRLEQISERAREISKLYFQARFVEFETGQIQQRVERILEQLLRERARGEGLARWEPGGAIV